MKPNSEKDFWYYNSKDGHTNIVYCIDGERMGKYSAIQYLIETYSISDGEAFYYVNEVVRHV
jgi:hypothetical protein